MGNTEVLRLAPQEQAAPRTRERIREHMARVRGRVENYLKIVSSIIAKYLPSPHGTPVQYPNRNAESIESKMQPPPTPFTNTQCSIF